MAIVEPVNGHHDNKNMRGLSRCPRLELRPPTVEAIEQALEDRAYINVRFDNVIVYDKQRMKQLAELVGSDSKDGLARLFEQLWHALARQPPKKSGSVRRHEKRWKPKLHSIPEEI